MASARGPAGGAAGKSESRGRIQVVDPAAEYAGLKPEIDAAVTRVLASGRYIGGPEIEGLEREFAAFCGVAHAVAVSSGTDALRFALMAAGSKPGAVGPIAAGDRREVITSPLTFIATTEAISQAGGRPVFVDVEPDSLTLDPARLEAALTPRTRAIVPIHLFGQMADMDPILECARRRDVAVVEDACQAHGALYSGRGGGAGRVAGSLGDAGCFSFYPSKNLGACGEGGLVTTGRADIADRVRRLRDHGQSEKYVHAEEGYNGRLDAVQAAILRVKLKRLAVRNERRRALAARYTARLTELGLAAPPGGRGARQAGAPLRLPVEKPWGTHAYHLYTVRLSGAGGGPGGASLRDRVRAGLLEQGIETGIHYPIPLHLQPAYAWMGLREGAFPESERAAREVLSLPIHPEMADDQVDRVCEALRKSLS
ncbi:MAG TPA: DegT/DnrJ/EryC1/StrS family aminotransferase [Candidatus Binatia bacterium]|nr:DegT/DnrJ/EryC1/StrS family aminotransferase [Candidatus Binatia bacterium]